jgi:ferredoxin-NADP reductase
LNLILPLPTGEIRRAYSISSAPDGSPRFELAVTEVTGGPGSGYLCGLGPGAPLRAVGPQGFYTRDPSDANPSLLVATGTGVTPLRSMMKAALGAGSVTPVWLLLGVRHADDILYREEFETLARKHDHVRVEFTLSQGDAGWSGRRGYVQSHVSELFAALAAEDRGEPHVYVCGLERMITAVRQLVRQDMGIPRQRVHSERYD